MAGKAKVTQLQYALSGQQHVLWLQVTVHHLHPLMNNVMELCRVKGCDVM